MLLAQSIGWFRLRVWWYSEFYTSIPAFGGLKGGTPANFSKSRFPLFSGIGAGNYHICGFRSYIPVVIAASYFITGVSHFWLDLYLWHSLQGQGCNTDKPYYLPRYHRLSVQAMLQIWLREHILRNLLVAAESIISPHWHLQSLLVSSKYEKGVQKWKSV